MNPSEIPESARAAFDEYPQIEATPAFNRAVLERLERESARHKTTFSGRLEAWLGLSLWRFAASGLLGALVPSVLLLGVMWSQRDAAPTQNRPAPTPLQVRALGPFYAREWEWKRDFNVSSTQRLRRRKENAPSTPGEILKGGVSCVDSRFPLA